MMCISNLITTTHTSDNACHALVQYKTVMHVRLSIHCRNGLQYEILCALVLFPTGNPICNSHDSSISIVHSWTFLPSQMYRHANLWNC